VALPAPDAVAPVERSAMSQRREGVQGSMTPLADRGDGPWQWRGSPRMAQQLGTSGRGHYRSYYGERRDDWGEHDDDDGRPRATGAYRTLCVRLCDGYYFPVSFSVLPDRLRRDRDVCAGRCGAQGRLFVHKSVGETPENMVDLQGRPYRELPTAFLYRTEHVPGCKCQPDPWEAASLDRHRAYALAAAASKGSKEAARELQGLRAKMKENALALQPAAGGEAKPRTSATPAARQADIAGREDGSMMGLGSRAAPGARGERAPMPAGRSRSEDWTRSIFQSGAGR
jgi:hypothetical protein